MEIDFNEVVAVVGAVVVVSVHFLKLTCRIKCPASEQVPVTVEWKGPRRDIKQLKSGVCWLTLKISSVFPGEFPRVLSIQTVYFCTRLLCALARTSPDVVHCLLVFSHGCSSVKIFLICGPP